MEDRLTSAHTKRLFAASPLGDNHRAGRARQSPSSSPMLPVWYMASSFSYGQRTSDKLLTMCSGACADQGTRNATMSIKPNITSAEGDLAISTSTVTCTASGLYVVVSTC